MFENLPVATILVSYVAVLFSLSVHEASHATAAYLLKDDTAKGLGRMTLNPIAHMDILGTVVLPLIGMVTGARVIGWAKPVPVDPSRLDKRFKTRVAYAMVAGAGPASNMIQAVLFLVILSLVIRFGYAAIPMPQSEFLAHCMFSPVEAFLKTNTFSSLEVVSLTILGRLVVINIGLAIFNLLPFGPLDGAGILRGFLPLRWLPTFDRIQPTLTIVILVLFLLGVMSYVLWPLYRLAEMVMVEPLVRLLLVS